MTIRRTKILAEKIVLGTATEEELLLYNRVCGFLESAEAARDHTLPGNLQEIKASLKKELLQKAGIN